MATGPETSPVPDPALTESGTCVGQLDLRAQDQVPSALRTDTPR
jgi:hypothetical protein